MTLTLVPAVWVSLICNLLLQLYDGALTYYLVSRGVPELNPLVDDTIRSWGTAWGLLYWKALACLSLVSIFLVRHRTRAVHGALALTATVYGCLAIIGFLQVFLYV
jgi:hypothetical protein